MGPTEILTREHRVIETVLTCLERLAGEAEEQGALDGAAAGEIVEFCRGYADRWHHGKEEEILFPFLEARGFSAEAGPTAVMRREHVENRELVGRMAESIEAASAGDSGALDAFTRAARAYVPHLRQHIEKEDHCLFPMASHVLRGAEAEDMARHFSAAEERMGKETQHRLLEIAGRLSQRFGVMPGETKTSGSSCS